MCCLHDLLPMCRYKEAEPFRQPVDWEFLKIPEYPLVITQPMDLRTCRSAHAVLWQHQHMKQQGRVQANIRTAFQLSNDLQLSATFFHIALAGLAIGGLAASLTCSSALCAVLCCCHGTCCRQGPRPGRAGLLCMSGLLTGVTLALLAGRRCAMAPTTTLKNGKQMSSGFGTIAVSSMARITLSPSRLKSCSSTLSAAWGRLRLQLHEIWLPCSSGAVTAQQIILAKCPANPRTGQQCPGEGPLVPVLHECICAPATSSAG